MCVTLCECVCQERGTAAEYGDLKSRSSARQRGREGERERKGGEVHCKDS